MTHFHSKGVKMRETAMMAALLQLKKYGEQLPIVIREADGGIKNLNKSKQVCLTLQSG